MPFYRNPFSLFIFFICCTTHLLYGVDINQSDIPFVITESGTYNLIENVTYGGHKNAITIKANNVVLNLNTFSITLSHDAIGVFAKNVSDFMISNGSIENKHNSSKKGSGINIVNANKGIIHNIATVNNRNGLFINNSHNIQVDNSAFFHATKSGVWVKNSEIINFDTCVFAQCNNGLTLKGTNRDCNLMNSDFP